MTLLPCGHDPARQFWGKCGVCGSLNRAGNSPTFSVPRSPEYKPPSRPHFLDQIADPGPTVSEPRTPTGKALLDAPDVLLMMSGDEIVGLNEGELELQVLAIEAEAAQPIDRFDRSWWHYADDCPASPTAQPIDVERLTRAIRTYRYNLDVNERSSDVAALAAVEYVRLSGEE